MFTNTTAENSIPLILAATGLDPITFYGKLLDVGCGRNANFVEYLRRRGIPADGIDPRVEKEADYLMHSDASSIPRPDRYYDFATATTVFFDYGTEASRYFLTALRGGTVASREEPQARKRMVGAVREISRVLKTGSRPVIWPEPRNLINHSAREITELNVEISREDVPECYAQRGSLLDENSYRTVLTKL